jgi:hypothetical protein
MVETPIWRASRTRAAGGRTSAASGTGDRGRAGLRLWTLLNAQALIHGTIGGPGDVAVIEDDRRRLAAREGS